MAVYKIFPTQDATLYSLYPDMNTGLDAILEISNIIGLEGTPNISRYIIQFDTEEIQDIIDNKIGNKLFTVGLRNFIAETQGINQNTYLEIRPVAQEWNNGTGYTLDSPQTTNGSSWNFSLSSGSSSWNMSGSNFGEGYTGSFSPSFSSQGGGNWYTASQYLTTESFSLRSVKDINADVNYTVNAWYSSSILNNGFIIKLPENIEFLNNQDIQPSFKYYSVDTNTIYPPCLEFKWRDYTTILSGSITGSIIDTVNLKISLSENPGSFYPESINRFYINVSPLYPARTYQTSSLFTNLNYLPTSSYYAIKDLDTNEFIINFDDQYTQISSDNNGNYFDVYMSGLEPERYYKIIIKTIINGSTIIFDDDYYFKVIN